MTISRKDFLKAAGAAADAAAAAGSAQAADQKTAGPTPRKVTAGKDGVVCGRGRNPTLRLWPAIFSGEIDVFPSERRNMGQEIGR